MAKTEVVKKLGIDTNDPLNAKGMERILSPNKNEIRKEDLGFKPEDVVKLNKELYDKNEKISRRERIEVEIIKDTRYLKVPERHSPSVAIAKTWIKEKIAKKVTQE